MMKPEIKSSYVLEKLLVAVQEFHGPIPLYQIDSATPNAPTLFLTLEYKHYVCIIVVFEN